MPMQTTFTGEKINVTEMTHSHLSNAIWFFRILHQSSDLRIIHLLKELDRRFNNVLLPYSPKLHFRGEIEWLNSAGMVVQVDEYKSNIVFKGEVVGWMFNSQEAEVAYYERETYLKETNNLLNQ